LEQHYVYRFYAKLRDCKPKVWRRFEMNDEKIMVELGFEKAKPLIERAYNEN
jgi:hypothetical protein